MHNHVSAVLMRIIITRSVYLPEHIGPTYKTNLDVAQMYQFLKHSFQAVFLPSWINEICAYNYLPPYQPLALET